MHRAKPSGGVTSAYITDMLIIQTAMLQRLSRIESIDMRQIGEVMGEIGSLYISLSESIRDTETSRPAYPSSDNAWDGIEHLWKSHLD
jgi:hypothetical protein